MREQAVAPFDVPLEELRRRTSEKWRRYPADVLPLFVAEMDVVPPEPVVRAVHDALTSGDTGYEGDRGYADAFAGFADERWGWAVDPAAARLVPDVMQGIAHVLRLLTEPGDAVVIALPVYPPFRIFVEHSGRRIVTAPLTPAQEATVNAMVTAISDALAKSDKVTLVGFGTFQVRERAAREGRNPRTGGVLKIPARKAPAFAAGKGLKEAVAGAKAKGGAKAKKK